jgi:hypothetical protein
MSTSNHVRSPETVHAIYQKLGDKLYQSNRLRSIYGQFKKELIHLETTREKRAEDMRWNFLDDKVKDAILQNKMTISTAIKQVKKIEIKLRNFKIIKQHTKPQGSTGLTHILQDIDGQIHRIDDLDTMESTLFTHFREHFNQATVILRETFGYGGHNANTQKLLDGTLTFDSTTLTQEMKWLLSNFRRSRPALDHHFPPEDIATGLLKWR